MYELYIENGYGESDTFGNLTLEEAIDIAEYWLDHEHYYLVTVSKQV